MKRRFFIVAILLSSSAGIVARAEPRSVPVLLARYDQGLAGVGYQPTGVDWQRFPIANGKKRLTFEAKKGLCYKIVVLADTDGIGVSNGLAQWGPLSYQRTKGQPKFSSGDALFDLGCQQTGVVAGTPLHPTLAANVDFVPVDLGTTFTARLYAKNVGDAEADAQWNKLGKQEGVKNRQFANTLDRCGRWRARFDACVAGKRPADYLRGASCRAAGEAERRDWGADACSKL